MAIAPIDLQTLFTQLDKAGRTQAPQKDGAIQQAIENLQIQRKTEENIQQVNEAQNTGDGIEKVNDRGQRQNKNKNNEKRQKEEAEVAETVSVLSDLNLGKKIDISL